MSTYRTACQLEAGKRVFLRQKERELQEYFTENLINPLCELLCKKIEKHLKDKDTVEGGWQQPSITSV